MLYKKGDPSDPANWRPIGITSTLYRIFTSHISNFIQKENKNNQIFHNSQRGFIANGGGPIDHINTLNELLYKAKRTNTEVYLTAIDLTNAFGSVNHQLIFDTLERKGFENTLVNIVKDIYRDNCTTIDVGGNRSGKILWKRGVLQGCPLSPLLFNSCIDPFLTHIERFMNESGVSFTQDAKTYTITAQAYADDIVLIANNIEGARSQITCLETFADIAGLKIAPQKCICIARTTQENPQIEINNNPIPIKKQNESITYLGAPISARKSTKIAYSRADIEEVRTKTKLIFKSQLTFTQKLQSLRTFILPTLDYTLMNGLVGKEDIESLDSYIRGHILNEINARNIPKEVIHLDMKNSGLGIPQLSLRASILKLNGFVSQVLSQQEHVRALTRLCISEEEATRRIHKIQEGDEQTFLDWKVVDGTIEEELPREKTYCIVNRAFTAAKETSTKLSIKEGNNVSMIVQCGNKEPITITKAKQINKVIKENVQITLRDKLTANPSRGHSFTGDYTMESNCYKGPKPFNDQLFKFLIKARTNTLPTPANLNAWGLSQSNNCSKCDSTCTLNHILNGCRPHRFMQYTWRHNTICARIKESIQRKYNPEYITENSAIDIRRLNEEFEDEIPDELSVLKPDIIFEEPETGNVNIIEVTVPYNQQTRRNEELKNTLDVRENEKEIKYHELVNFTKNATNRTVTLYTIVVSSLGHVTRKTKCNLIKLFGDKWAKKLAEGISLDAIRCSAVIYTNKTPEWFGFTPKINPPNSNNDDESTEENNPIREDGTESVIDESHNGMQANNENEEQNDTERETGQQDTSQDQNNTTITNNNNG